VCSPEYLFVILLLGLSRLLTSLSQDVKLLVEDIGVLKPTIFCAVPRVLDRIFSGKELLETYVSQSHK